MRRGYKTNGIIIYICNVWIGATDGRLRQIFLIMDANTFDKSTISVYFK